MLKELVKQLEVCDIVHILQLGGERGGGGRGAGRKGRMKREKRRGAGKERGRKGNG